MRSRLKKQRARSARAAPVGFIRCRRVVVEKPRDRLRFTRRCRARSQRDDGCTSFLSYLLDVHWIVED